MLASPSWTLSDLCPFDAPKMSRRKKSGLLDWLADFSLHSLLLHPFSLFVLATAIVVIGAAALWKQHREQIAAEQFQLTVEKIDVTEQPNWIKQDLRQVVYDGSRLNDWSLLDVEIVSKVRDAFAIDPWVEDVLRVEKTAAGIEVDIKYRKPVAMVEFGGKHLLPIDANGIVLDGSGFQIAEVKNYLRISVPDPVGGQIVTGQAWPDARVVEAANIAEILEDIWREAKLIRIVNLSPPTHDPSKVGKFELWSKNDVKLVWGQAPGKELANEVSAQKKIAAILEFVKQKGAFDKQDRGQLDVRQGEIQVVPGQMRRVSHRQK